MEVKENKTLQKILDVAKTEFLQKGFKDSSLREIVKKAGVTTGAFYGYFKSKEDLFDALVKKHADYIINIYDTILADFQNLPVDQQCAFMDNHSQYGIEKMFDYVWNHKNPFILIYKSSAGTKYENFVQQIAKKDIESTEVFLDTVEENGKKIQRIDPIIEDLILNNAFNMFFSLILRDLPREKVEHCLDQLFTFHRGGWDLLLNIS